MLQTAETPENLPQYRYWLRRLGVLAVAAAVVVTGFNGTARLLDNDEAVPSADNGDVPAENIGQNSADQNSIDDKLTDRNLKHGEISEKYEVSRELQEQLKANTVIIKGTDMNGEAVEGTGLIVSIKGEDGEPDQQRIFTAAHIIDLDKKNNSKPIRQRLGATGALVADIAPYLDFPFTVQLPGQPEVRVVKAAVNTNPDVDTDLAVIKTEEPIKPANAIYLPADLSTVYDDTTAPSKNVYISAIVNGEPRSVHGSNRLSGVFLFQNNQRSDLVAVPGDACESGWSGAGIAGTNRVELGKVVHEVWDPTNPAHAQQIAEFKSLGLVIPHDNTKICQLIDGTEYLGQLIHNSK